VLEGKKIREITDEDERNNFIKAREKEYREKFANPYEAASYGYIDDVIEPRNTRFRVIRALQALASKKDSNPPKKHSTLPL
jgi:acetyl-CoA carboxylase carboxyltransferase component